ncbi:MAG: hypothetical protein NVS1B13_04740 [Flavisolibacter sp.]
MRKVLLYILVLVLIIGGIMLYWNYYNVYSNGERKGVLIKVTHKGNFFKTFEGEMWLSCRQVVNAEKFYFTVIDNKLADSLGTLQDNCIEVSYKQYRNTLPWRGDNPYIIVSYKKL